MTLNAYPDETGRATSASFPTPWIPTRARLHVRVVLPNADTRIKPAMFGTIRFLRSSSQGILVPAAAVIREGNDAYIFVEQGNGRFERRDVKLGQTSTDHWKSLLGIDGGRHDRLRGARFSCAKAGRLAADAQPDRFAAALPAADDRRACRPGLSAASFFFFGWTSRPIPILRRRWSK